MLRYARKDGVFLQEKYTALTSSIILGALWGLWHLPVFFLPGSIFTLMPVGSLMFWLYMINEILLTIIFTWVYNNTSRSILAVILLHIMLEVCANTGLIPWDRPENLYNVALGTIVAIILILTYGRKTLAKRI